MHIHKMTYSLYAIGHHDLEGKVWNIPLCRGSFEREATRAHTSGI